MSRRKVKEIYYRHKIEEITGNPKEMWNILREATHIKPNLNTDLKLPNIGEETIYFLKNPEKILNHVNDFFTNVGMKLAN